METQKPTTNSTTETIVSWINSFIAIASAFISYKMHGSIFWAIIAGLGGVISPLYWMLFTPEPFFKIINDILAYIR